MKLAAFILCVISTVAMGIMIVPLIWCIPMTIAVYKAYKGEKELSVGFNVCVLLFVNTISGILLLVDNSESDANKGATKVTKTPNAEESVIVVEEDEEEF